MPLGVDGGAAELAGWPARRHDLVDLRAEAAGGVERALRRRRERYAVIGEVRKGRRGVSFTS